MRHPKFIIYGNELRIGRVDLHKQLLPEQPDLSKVYGGGLWRIDKEAKRLHLSGRSHDFGRFDESRALTCELPARLADFQVVIDDQ